MKKTLSSGEENITTARKKRQQQLERRWYARLGFYGLSDFATTTWSAAARRARWSEASYLVHLVLVVQHELVHFALAIRGTRDSI